MTLNWFAVGAGLLYIGAAYSSYRNATYAFAGMWLCYAIANFCLTIAEANK